MCTAILCSRSSLIDINAQAAAVLVHRGTLKQCLKHALKGGQAVASRRIA